MNVIRPAAAGIVCCLGLICADRADAQSPRRTTQPTSPYLELTRPGDPGLNYYRRVRPELEFRSAISAQQRAIDRLSEKTASRTEQRLPATGRGATFMNLSHFFGNRGSVESQATR